MNDALRIQAFCAVTAVSLMQTAPVLAQTGDASISEVIVTARRVEERLQDVPISMTVLSQQQITNLNIVNASDLAAYTPSLSTNTNFGTTNTVFSIRGFSQEFATQPSVGVYFADVVAPRGAANNLPIGDGAGPGSFFDLQNVQVLKGPQGTLFGRNTTGGAILLVPQKPTDSFEGYVQGSYGNYNMNRIQGVLNAPLSDSVRFRIGVDHQTRDGYVESRDVGKKDFGDVGYTAVRASLVVDITPNLENYTVASYLRSDTTGHIQKIIGCNPTQSAENFLGLLGCAQLEREKDSGFYSVRNPLPNPRTSLTQAQIVNSTTWQASDWLTVKNIASYAELKQSLRTALNGTDLDLSPLGFPAGTRPGFVNINPLPGHSTANESTLTEEFRLEGNGFDHKLIWQAGAYIEVSKPLDTVGSFSAIFMQCTDASALQCTNPLGFGTINDTENRTSYHDKGLYAQSTYSLTDKLSLTGGLRYTWDRAHTDAVLKTLTVPTPGTSVVAFCNEPSAPFPSCDLHYTQRSEAPTWLIDLDYKPIEGILLYAKWARGYRAGGVAPQAPKAYSTFDPEKVDSYEIGAKTSFSEPLEGILNIAAFYNNLTDQQLALSLLPRPNSGVSPASAVLNAGESRIYGAEVEVSITPFEGFTLEASYAYLNTEVQKVTAVSNNDPRYFVASDVRPGDPLPLTPKNQYTLTGTYVLPLDQSMGRVALSATYAHFDEQLTNYIDKTLSAIPAVAELSFLKTRDIVNLNLNWTSIAGTPIDLGLFATNVTNKKYYSYVPGLVTSVGFEAATLGEPRMYGMRLQYNFGN